MSATRLTEEYVYGDENTCSRTGSGGFELGNTRIGGANDGDVWSSWNCGSYAEVDFYSDSTPPDPQQPRSCYRTPAQCGGMPQWCPNASSWDPVQQCVDCQYPYAGIQLAGFEYQQWQSMLSTPVWTPLRFPGQMTGACFYIADAS